MFRNLVLSAVTALALLTPVQASTVTPPPSGGPAVALPVPKKARHAPGGDARPAASRSTYAVYSRRPGETTWREAGNYPSHQRAVAAANDLYRRGFEVQLLARTTMTHVPAVPEVGPLSHSETVTLAEAKRVFDWLAGMQDISFGYVDDGCYARAHLMIQRMQARGLRPAKVWSFANGEPLHVKRTNGAYVTWRYHVAPMLRVRLNNGKQAWAVMDPSMFPGPVPISKWSQAQKKPGGSYNPYITLTRLGQAPLDPHGRRYPGTGYVPGADPSRDLNGYSMTIMRRYKPMENNFTTWLVARRSRPTPAPVLASARPVVPPSPWAATRPTGAPSPATTGPLPRPSVSTIRPPA
jgi:hypothetical protein